MRAPLLAAGVSVLVLAPATPAAGESQRMTLDCGRDIGVIERSNGASWWGVDDGAVYTTKYLRVEDEHGVFEKSYGHAASEHEVCLATHTSPGYSSTWTVHLVLAQ